MKLNIDLLENKRTVTKSQGSAIVARCPACAEQGGDRKGDHLIVFPDGRFGCIQFQGQSDESRQHRRRIFQIAGATSGTARILNQTNQQKSK